MQSHSSTKSIFWKQSRRILWEGYFYGLNIHMSLLFSCSVMSNSFMIPKESVAHQDPLWIGFSMQEYWSGLPCPPPGDLPTHGSSLHLLCLLLWQAGSLPLAWSGKPSPGTKITATLTWISSLQNCEKTNLCFLSIQYIKFCYGSLSGLRRVSLNQIMTRWKCKGRFEDFSLMESGTTWHKHQGSSGVFHLFFATI